MEDLVVVDDDGLLIGLNVDDAVVAAKESLSCCSNLALLVGLAVAVSVAESSILLTLFLDLKGVLL